MIDSPLKKYFEENIQKGYTIEQIRNNLKNNGYPDSELDEVVQSLSVEYLELSRRNPSLFDYSSLPKEIRSSVEGTGNKDSSSSVDLGRSQQPQKSMSGGDLHPGMDTQTKVKFGVVLASILLVIVLGSMLLASSGDRSSELDSTGDSPQEEVSPSDDVQGGDDATQDPVGDNTSDNTSDDTSDAVFELDAEEDCGDFDCMTDLAEQCEGSAERLNEQTIRPFSFTFLQSYNFSAHNDTCVLKYSLESFRRRYDNDEKELMMQEDDMSESEIYEEELDMLETDKEHDPDDYSMICRFSNSSVAVSFFENLSEGSDGGVSCPEDASTGHIFSSVEGIKISQDSTNLSCFTHGVWDDIDCVKYDPDYDMDELIELLDVQSSQKTNPEEFGELDDFESEASGYRDTRGNPCENDDQCFDGDVQTINYCEENVCHVMLDDGRECVSGDNFCPPRCYGQNITDCEVDGEIMCSEDEHCEDGDPETDFLCRDNRCVYFEVDPPNEPPVIDEYPPTEAFVGEKYEFIVEAEDPDGDNVTFSLENAPENMTINESTGRIEWYPVFEDYHSGDFRVVVSDGVDETHHNTRIIIYMRQDDDSLYESCGDDMNCYLNTIYFNDDYQKCKQISHYWDEPSAEVYDCLTSIAENTGDEDLCDYVFDDDTRDDCIKSVNG